MVPTQTVTLNSGYPLLGVFSVRLSVHSRVRRIVEVYNGKRPRSVLEHRAEALPPNQS